MKHIAICIAAVVALATPALAEQGESPPQRSSASRENPSQVAGRFALEVANGNEGFLNPVEEGSSSGSAPPALNNQATAQAQAAAPQVQLPPPQTVTQSRQVRTQRRVPSNP